MGVLFDEYFSDLKWKQCNRATVLRNQRRQEKMRKLAEAVKKNPSDPVLLYKMGKYYYTCWNKEAISYFKRAINNTVDAFLVQM